ncbi:efflux RND transporter periplasmic adaptor subunit [Acetonema longum]|uniref:Efflux transporter, RND family, MFP subunit n=1 Tax=Acetonema longum DSM 6540 TaxID=1009370 RepID=F7NGJ7_9FIRM|nr:efflux RND transporter periplasmic adaptor subunit [Acetonema longum]EGO64801.1 efflux transporter, RND family, MFP subunit [Acetonema longum DSM 6540]
MIGILWGKIRPYLKWLIILAVAAAAVTFGWRYYAGAQEQPAAAGPAILVERGDIMAQVSATGTLKPVNMVDVSSKITGLIKELRVAENQQVTANQILLVLDDTRLQAQLSQARARLANAAANNERNERLSKIGAVSKQQLDSSRLEYNLAQASYDEVASDLDDTVIRAPINGTVIGEPIPAGQTVAPGISNPMVIMTIADMSKMQIDTQVDESDIGKVAVGQKVTFTVDAYSDRTFNGTVSNISQKANVQQNVVYYNVVIDVDTEGSQVLKPTMTARVTLNVGESTNVLLVPLSAVKSSKGQQYVQVLKDGHPQNVNVTTGLMSDEKIEITSGLEDGDQVLVSQTKAPANAGSMRMPGMRMPR